MALSKLKLGTNLSELSVELLPRLKRSGAVSCPFGEGERGLADFTIEEPACWPALRERERIRDESSVGRSSVSTVLASSNA